jgi:hypothetical protein
LSPALVKLSKSLASHLDVGSRVVTVNKRLDESAGFKLSRTFIGPCPDSITSEARAYVYDFTGKPRG